MNPNHKVYIACQVGRGQYAAGKLSCINLGGTKKVKIGARLGVDFQTPPKTNDVKKRGGRMCGLNFAVSKKK